MPIRAWLGCGLRHDGVQSSLAGLVQGEAAGES